MRVVPKLYHLYCGKISDELYASITEIVWYSESCAAVPDFHSTRLSQYQNKERDTPQVKLFLMYVDDIVETVRGKPNCVLDAANSLRSNLQFILGETNSEGNLPFLDLNINISQDRSVTCNWYQKPTDTGNILKYRSVVSKALYTELLGVQLTGSKLIRLSKLIGRNG